jgi:hypothetical protein
MAGKSGSPCYPAKQALSLAPATVTDVNAMDSDGDGASDGQESVAGSNPLDAEALLELVWIQTGAVVQVG